MKFALASLVTGVAAVGAYLRSPVLYETQTAKEKFDYLMGRIQEDATPAAWPPSIALNPFSSLAGLFLESMKPTVELNSDEMPDGRYKLIHSVGGAASVKIVPAPEQPYTGIFEGSDYGLIRLASATEPKEGPGNDSVESSFVPGLGVKFLRDGVHSGNIFFLHTLTPQVGSWNFFKNEQSNHLTADNLGTAENLLAAKFKTSGSNWPTMVGLSDLARYKQDGTAYSDEEIKFPFQLVLKPHADLINKFPDNYDRTLIEQLRTIPVGSTLYHIYAKETNEAPPTLVGDLVTTSAIESSVYADTKLFLKHQMMEEDFALMDGSFLEKCPNEGDCPVCPVAIAC